MIFLLYLCRRISVRSLTPDTLCSHIFVRMIYPICRLSAIITNSK